MTDREDIEHAADLYDWTARQSVTGDRLQLFLTHGVDRLDVELNTHEDVDQMVWAARYRHDTPNQTMQADTTKKLGTLLGWMGQTKEPPDDGT